MDIPHSSKYTKIDLKEYVDNAIQQLENATIELQCLKQEFAYIGQDDQFKILRAILVLNTLLGERIQMKP
jgi:hypothetical protein